MSNHAEFLVSSRTKQREALAYVIRFLATKGWSPGTGGNFSVVINTEPLLLLMSPSGIDKGEVTAEQLIVVNASGKVIEGDGKPSAETDIHLFLCAELKAQSVLHTHSTWNTLLSKTHFDKGHISFSGFEMLKALGASTHETTKELPIFDNDQDIKRFAAHLDANSNRLSQLPGFLMRGHGLYSWGDSLYSAKRHVEALEFLLEIAGTERILEVSSTKRQ